MVRLKDQELDELRRQMQSGTGNAAKLTPNGIGYYFHFVLLFVFLNFVFILIRLAEP